MTEAPRPPSLPNAADAEPYVPISWMAVAAFGAAVAFLLLLAVLAAVAFSKRQPLVEPWLVVLPIGVLALSFAGRRMIRNSEGTRTGAAYGIDLTAVAWWAAVVVGLGYATYLAAVEYAVKRDAAAEVARWMEHVGRGDVPAAFHATLPPERKGKISASDAARMKAEFRWDYVQFEQSSLVRTALRNKGEASFVPGGLKEWSFQPGGITSSFAGTLVCPEGRYHVVVPLRATEGLSAGADKAPSAREWQVVQDPNGYVASASLTPYGWAVSAAASQGNEYAARFLKAQSYGHGTQVFAYLDFALHGDLEADPELAALAAARLAATGGLGEFLPPPQTWSDRAADRLFAAENGTPPTAAQRDRFRLLWRTTGLVPPGSRLKESKDRGESLTVGATGLELRVPVELPVAGPEGEPTAARGRLVVARADAALLAALKQWKASADPERTTERPPADIGLPPGDWRVVRVESDLVPVPVRPPQKQPGR